MTTSKRRDKTTMAKRLKLRIIYRAIATTLDSCRSKHTSILPQDPVPIHHQTTTNHHLSSAVPTAPHPLHFKWQKDNDDLTFAPPSADKNRTHRKKKKKKKNKNSPSRLHIMSTSSADSGWFSSDAEETQTLVSSPELREMRRNKCRRPASRKTKRRGVAAETEAPARLSMFKKLIPCTVDGKVKESFAVVKRSDDPYEDFKNSMMDMILEKQMFDENDLEQLLQCFLSLNSRHCHGIIVQAFSEIWETIFYPPARLGPFIRPGPA